MCQYLRESGCGKWICIFSGILWSLFLYSAVHHQTLTESWSKSPCFIHKPIKKRSENFDVQVQLIFCRICDDILSDYHRTIADLNYSQPELAVVSKSISIYCYKLRNMIIGNLSTEKSAVQWSLKYHRQIN